MILFKTTFLLSTFWVGVSASEELKPLRDLSTDRPDRTESPYTVDVGRIQVESDLVTFSYGHEGQSKRSWFGTFITNLKLGIHDRVDIQLVVEPLVVQRNQFIPTADWESLSGCGDLTARLKVNLIGNDGNKHALGLMPFLVIPTARDGLGVEKTEGGIIIPFAIELTPKVGLGLMSEIDFIYDGSVYQTGVVTSAVVGFDLSPTWGMYAEMYSNNISAMDFWEVTADVGVTFSPFTNIQFDSGINVGLTDDADDVNPFVGLSRKF